MLPTLEQLGIDQLSTADRLVLAREILDSVIVDRGPPSLTPLQEQLIDERLADYEANPQNVVSWEQVKADALARFKP